jgi:DNA replication protein DnaC
MSTGSMPMESLVLALCRTLKLPTVGRNAAREAEEALRQGTDPLAYLLRLLELEIEERDGRRAARRLKEAGIPLMKTLEGFDFRRVPEVPEALVRKLAEGDYVGRAETVIFLGEPGTGKTHLATALAVAAARQGRPVRFVTAARLVNELVEAKDARELSRTVARYARVEVLVIDELGYLPMSKAEADLLFQVLSERNERSALILTTNLPFSEWTSVFADPRLCRAVIDRITHRSHIIDTGAKSVRLEEALRRRGKEGGAAAVETSAGA